VDVDHANSLVGGLTLRDDWKLDEQTFQQDSGYHQE
jgi:hypothetical protein